VRLFRVGLLVTLIAAALIGVLWVTDVIPQGELDSVAGKAFGVIAIVFLAAFVWRVVRGRASVYDHTDQPVP
jgi:hypothetical protein